MMRKQLRSRRPALVVIFLIAICTTTLAAQPPEELEGPVIKLTKAVQAVVRYPDDGVTVADDQLLQVALKDKPELQAALKDVVVKIRHDDKEVIVLVCSPDGKFAWLEDASWTPFVDLKWYATDAQHSCGAFTLDPSMAHKKEEVSRAWPGAFRELASAKVQHQVTFARGSAAMRIPQFGVSPSESSRNFQCFSEGCLPL